MMIARAIAVLCVAMNTVFACQAQSNWARVVFILLAVAWGTTAVIYER